VHARPPSPTGLVYRAQRGREGEKKRKMQRGREKIFKKKNIIIYNFIYIIIKKTKISP